MLLLADCIGMINRSARYRINSAELKDAVDKYLTKYRLLYGASAMTPKFHSLHHFATFLQRWGHIPNCWALERKHKSPKQYANAVKNTAADWEGPLSREVTCNHLAALGSDRFNRKPSLVDARPAGRQTAAALAAALGCEAHEVRCSRSARVDPWETVFVGDVCMACVLGSVKFFEVSVLAGVQHDDETEVVALVEELVRVEAGTKSSKFRKSGVQSCVDIGDFRCACVWARSSDVWTVVHPTHVLPV